VNDCITALSWWIASRNNFGLQLIISWEHQQVTPARLAISPRAAHFLIVTFQTRRKIQMNHCPNVWFIHTHSKGCGGTNNVQLI